MARRVLGIVLAAASLLVSAPAAAGPGEGASTDGAGLFASPAPRPSVVIPALTHRRTRDMKALFRAAETIPEQPILVYPWMPNAFDSVGVMISGQM